MGQVFVAGQRWTSETEPELGLGIVRNVSQDRVGVEFPAVGEQRQYAIASAPLRRHVLRPGDAVAWDGGRAEVAAVVSRGGRCAYRTTDGLEIDEADLSAVAVTGGADRRLLSGRADPERLRRLRLEALDLQHRRRSSPVRGFAGGRMDLIPHQLYIAREVALRHAPRVLLADEVGLGKTIEACLIVHRLLCTGRAARVLVVVPEPLVHQWFLELLRRFNLWFPIYDEERCAAIESAHPGSNPFTDDQWALCALPLLLDSRRLGQAAAAGWDVVVVDEAHHLGWSPDAPSREYQAIETLARGTPGLLLLTATPEQLGLESHFARLRLLDPDRYSDLARFRAEAEGFAEVASVAAHLEAGASWTPRHQARLHRLLGDEPGSTRDRLEALAAGDAEARREVLADLLDRHGTGRVMFRNTRAAIRGFPRRRACPVPLKAGSVDGSRLLEALAAEYELDRAGAGFLAGGGWTPEFSHDPRVAWLEQLLRRHRQDKVLLICRSPAKVLALEAALRERTAAGIALFHEGLELVQRDRNAAWFADPDGAQILLASEIGSEGRNFQFAHHLVLFDLPADPELVEQRIGRLDRIGQKEDIRIHVPHVVNSPQEVLFRWYHDGLDAFGKHLVAGRELRERFGTRVHDLAQDFHETHDARRAELEALVAETAGTRRELERRLEAGRDRLLELNSFRPEPARELVGMISREDGDLRLQEFLLRAWDEFGVPVEDLGPRSFKLGGDGVYAEPFPGVPPEGVLATFDRREALGREDVAFLTWDHPMVTGVLDLLLGRPEGGTACVSWENAPRPGIWLETVHLLELLAPAALHADRFLPPTPVRVVVDRDLGELPPDIVALLDRARLCDTPVHDWLDLAGVRGWVESAIAASTDLARRRAEPLVQQALAGMERALGHELERLRALAAVNPNVRPEEVQALGGQRDALRRHLAESRVRLDSVRLIVSPRA